MMVERYRHIDQLIGKRVASFYINEHVSRIEALVLKNERINEDKALADIMEATEKVSSALAAARFCQVKGRPSGLMSENVHIY